MGVNIRYRKIKKSKDSKRRYSAYLDIYSKGNRFYEYPKIYVSEDYSKRKSVKPCDRDNINLINSIKAKTELSIINNEYGFSPSFIKRADFIEYFEKVCVKKNHRSYWCTLNKLKNFTNERLSFYDFNENKVVEFINYMLLEVSQSTANHYLKVLNVVFNMSIRDKITNHNPIRDIPSELKPKRLTAKREFLIKEELSLLSETPFKRDNHIKEAFLFSCLTGLRVSDLMSITHEQIINGTLKYRQQKSKEEFHYLPLTKSALEIVESLKKSHKSNLIFWKLPSSTSYSNRQIKDWVKDAGINKNISWHCGRHTFACLLLEENVSLFTVSKLLGHSSISITEIYAKIINKTKEDAISKLPILSL